jgi:hypothetical protein
MSNYKVGYFVGSLSTSSINRRSTRPMGASRSTSFQATFS